MGIDVYAVLFADQQAEITGHHFGDRSNLDRLIYVFASYGG